MCCPTLKITTWNSSLGLEFVCWKLAETRDMGPASREKSICAFCFLSIFSIRDLSESFIIWILKKSTTVSFIFSFSTCDLKIHVFIHCWSLCSIHDCSIKKALRCHPKKKRRKKTGLTITYNVTISSYYIEVITLRLNIY